MIVVHHLGLSQSERIVWLCEELDLEYEVKRYDRRTDNGLAPDDYKALHPMGIAPVITDGSLVLGESGAICDYICERHGEGRLRPAVDDPEFADHLFWFHWSNGTFMTTQMMSLALARGSGDNPALSFIDDRNARSWSMMDARLGQQAFFGGADLTTADIMMVFCLTTSRAFFKTPLDDFPNVKAYLERIGARPAYQRAMAKAEPGMTPMLT